jgi:OmpA-OmpF porin, OOP family
MNNLQIVTVNFLLSIVNCRLLTIFLFLILSFPSFAQYTSTNKKAIKLYQEADLLIKNRQFDPGMAKLHEAIEKDPNFVEAHLKLGSSYYKLGNKDKAKYHFEKASILKPNSKELVGAYFTVGEIYFNDGEYEKAIKYFERVVSVNPIDKKIIESTARYMEKSHFGIEAKKKPVQFSPQLMSPAINKYFSHSFPVLTADLEVLIFTKRDGTRLDQDEDIVVSKKVNGTWTEPVSISSNINSQFNEGACTMSADGKVLVFVSCNRPDGLGSCDLYISYKEADVWSKPVNIGSNVNSNVWDSEPSISADGKTLYFASERKGGYGMEDIWMSQMDEKGEWSKAINLGNTINTQGREVSPFIHASGNTLYFSSNYHLGLGGFDIFCSRYDGASWSVPKNLGYPINTYLNDASVFISADNKKGFYSAYEKKDISYNKALLYEFEVPKEIVDENNSTYARGTIYDSETKKKLGAKIELIDLKTNKVIQSVSSDSQNGNYLIVLTEGKEYALYVTKESYLFKSVFFDYTSKKIFDPLALDVFLDPVKVGKTVVLNNIFFATNSYALEDKSKTELDKIINFLILNPKVNIEFGGHTDDVGSDKDNLDLSLKRAKAVYDYVVKSGILVGQIKYRGYGETKPLMPNTSEENRQLNRRIEFKVL